MRLLCIDTDGLNRSDLPTIYEGEAYDSLDYSEDKNIFPEPAYLIFIKFDMFMGRPTKFEKWFSARRFVPLQEDDSLHRAWIEEADTVSTKELHRLIKLII